MRFAALLAATAIAAAGVTAAPAIAAETVVPVDKFTAVELHGGGTINIRQGPVQRVTLITDDPKVVGLDVTERDHGGRLIISSCKGFCMGRHHLEVEIVTPELNGAVIHGGGHILAEGAFPSQGAVAVAIHGGGDIDLKAVPAQAASASIMGGGKIVVSAQNSLSASIMGGGAIHYAGHPAVSSSIHGGGAISPIQ
jgi:Putative auto-transporter adhesin, head GIN domain